MLIRYATLLFSLACLSGCHQRRPDHTDPKGVPPPAHAELTWESFFHEPWRDPLHEKYEELFAAPFPNRSPQHFAVARPFSDVKTFGLAFDATAVAGVRPEIESGGGEHAVSMQLPDSAGKPIEVHADDAGIRLTFVRLAPARRYHTARAQETIVPLPAGADPSSARVIRDGDWVRIKFNSRDSGRPHGK